MAGYLPGTGRPAGRNPLPPGWRGYIVVFLKWVLYFFDTEHTETCFLSHQGMPLSVMQLYPFLFFNRRKLFLGAMTSSLRHHHSRSLQNQQQRFEHEQTKKGKKVPHTTKLDISRSVEIATKKAATSINAPLAFKQAGLSNAMDGSEDGPIDSHLKSI